MEVCTRTALKGGSPWLVSPSMRATDLRLITEVCTRTALKIGWVGAWIWMSGHGGTHWLVSLTKRATGSRLITEVCTRTALKIGWVGACIWISGQADLTKHEGKRLKDHHRGVYENRFEDWMGECMDMDEWTEAYALANLSRQEDNRLKAHHGGLYEDYFEDRMGVAVYGCREVRLG